jgi:hypothetical protein
MIYSLRWRLRKVKWSLLPRLMLLSPLRGKHSLILTGRMLILLRIGHVGLPMIQKILNVRNVLSKQDVQKRQA